MSQILHVNANLVLTTRFQFQFHQTMAAVSPQHTVMRHSILASIVGWRRIRKIRLIVLQPALYGATLLFELAGNKCQITTISHNIAPVVFQNLFSLHGFGINQQARSIAVQTVNNVRRTALMRTMKIIIKHLLYAK